MNVFKENGEKSPVSYVMLVIRTHACSEAPVFCTVHHFALLGELEVSFDHFFNI